MSFQSRLLCTVLIICLVTVNITWSTEYISPSTRANGMGEVGVSLVDHKSFYYNPGALGMLMTETNFLVTVNPLSSKSDFSPEHTFSSFSLAGGICILQSADSNNLYLGGGFFRTADAGSYLNESINNFIVSLGIKDKINLGLGLNYKRKSFSTSGAGLESSYPTDYAFDFGILASKDFTINLSPSEGQSRKVVLVPAFGVSWSGYKLEGETDIIKYRRIGASLKVTRLLGDMTVISITPVIEVESILQSLLYGGMLGNIYKAGVEIGLYEIIYGRLGCKGDSDDFTGLGTYGFTVSTKGISNYFNLKRNYPENRIVYLLDHCIVEFSLARYIESDMWDPFYQKFTEISITYKL